MTASLEKHLCIHLCLALIVAGHALAATVVPAGPATGVWTRSGSPYYVTGGVVVPHGRQLVIEAGVTVFAYPGCAMTIRGVLTVLGSETEPVVMTASDTAGGWHGIHFINADHGSRLLYCTISRGRATDTLGSGNPSADRSHVDRVWDQNGGGVFCVGSHPVFEHCVLSHNWAFGNGGAVFGAEGSPLSFSGCVFSDNRSIHYGGGGVYLSGASTVIENCRFERNVASKWTGGGLYAIASRIAVLNSTFLDNSAYGGGGLFLQGDSSIVKGCTISGNSAKYGGGIECNEKCDTRILDNVIEKNTADYGGGIAVVEQSNVIIDRCTISGNLARKTGGGIFTAEVGRSRISRSAISGNISEGDGGGLTCLDVEPTLEHLVVLNNSAFDRGGGLYLEYANPLLHSINLKHNAARNGGGVYIKNCPRVDFSTRQRSSVHQNTAREIGADLFVLGGPSITIPLDTFTVDIPGDLLAYPAEKLLIDHEHTALSQESADLYVALDGDDSRNGLSPSSALRTVTMALMKILSDSLHPRTLHLANGEYPASILSSPYAAAGLRFISFSGGTLADMRIGSGTIVVSTPWWKSPAALGLYSIVFGSAGFFLYRTRIKRLRMEHQLRLEHVQTERLAEVDRLKSRFFANISHEFRTPLTLIIGPAELAMKETEDGRIQKRLELIKRNAEKLHGLVNQILDFSRLEAGDMKLAVGRGEAVSFVNRVVQSFQSWAERKRITLSFLSDQEKLEAWFDPDKLEKIVNNLVSNALKFTAEGGRVDIELKMEDGRSRMEDRRLKTEVKDTGCGIAEEHLPHIFDRFYRIDESHKTEGTGIGLALTKELVDLHHGTIAVQSKPGEGTTFTVTIPTGRSAYTDAEIVELPPGLQVQSTPLSSDAGVPSSDSSIPEETEPGEKPIVLVVEDNADVRAYVREHLTPEYSVLEAENGCRAIEKSREAVPDIVVSDVMMPEMDGYELTRALKQDERTCHIPVILLTARAASESKIEGLETGADDYLTKPFDARELLVRIRNLIQLRRKLREKFSQGIELKPGQVAVASLDDEFLKRVMCAVEKNMNREEFTVDELSHAVFLSRMQLYRKLVAVTNLTPSDFIKRMRLQRARELLEKNSGNVAEIAEAVGFSNHSHFTRCFQEEFGMLPGDVRHRGKPAIHV